MPIVKLIEASPSTLSRVESQHVDLSTIDPPDISPPSRLSPGPPPADGFAAASSLPRNFPTGGLDLFLLCSIIVIMTDRPASWRFPTMKQIQKLANAPVVGKNASPASADDLAPAYWQALLRDPRADVAPAERLVQECSLSEIGRHLLRVSCSRCSRIVEIQQADAVRLYGPCAVWKDVGQKLLDNTCTQRTGRHEEDGCWPSFE